MGPALITTRAEERAVIAERVAELITDETPIESEAFVSGTFSPPDGFTSGSNFFCNFTLLLSDRVFFLLFLRFLHGITFATTRLDLQKKRLTNFTIRLAAAITQRDVVSTGPDVSTGPEMSTGSKVSTGPEMSMGSKV